MGKLQKQELRRRLRRARGSMGRAERMAAEQKINRLLKRCIKRGAKIGLYWPIGKELRLDSFAAAAGRRGAEIYLPYIEPGKRRLWFSAFDGTQKPERKRGRAKLQIPQFGGKKIRAQHLNVLVVPIVGMDRSGYRLGQNGGFYDATLAAVCGGGSVYTIGAGFGCQLVDSLPHEPHDIPLNAFVSERGWLRFRTFSDGI